VCVRSGHFLCGVQASGEVFLWHKETDTLRITAPLDAVAQEVQRELQAFMANYDHDKHKKLDGKHNKLHSKRLV
jgi:hypothetical protein